MRRRRVLDLDEVVEDELQRRWCRVAKAPDGAVAGDVEARERGCGALALDPDRAQPLDDVEALGAGRAAGVAGIRPLPSLR